MSKVATLTPEAAAAQLGISKKTIMQWARVGRIQAAKVGRNWFFAQRELDELLTPRNQLTRGRPLSR